MLQAAQSGDPTKAADAMVEAGMMSKEARDMMVVEAQKEKEGLATLANQIHNNTEAIRILSYNQNQIVNAVNKVWRLMDLTERVWKKNIPGYKADFEEIQAEREAHEAAEKAKWEAEHNPKSNKSEPVATSKIILKSS
jgi:hypothetical protein